MDPLSSAPAAPAASAASTSRSYLDFDGLSQLKGQARQDAKSATRETATQFEALFIQMMMKSMREAGVKSDLNESSAKDTFEGMFDREVSVAMAKRNTLGLADMLVKNMPATDAASTATSTAAMLQARELAGSPAMPLAQAANKSFPLKVSLPTLQPLQRPGPMPLKTPVGRLDRNGL